MKGREFTMWEAIRDVLLSPNVTIILIFVLLVLMTAIFLSKSGLMQIHTEAVQIGAISHEREVVWQQCEWIRSHYDSIQTQIPHPDGYNEWRGKYLATLIMAQWFEWIYMNHFREDPSYVEIKQDRIVQMIKEHTVMPEFQCEEFEGFIRADVKECIKKLIKIRKVFK